MNEAIFVSIFTLFFHDNFSFLRLFEMPCSLCPGSMVIKVSVSNYTELNPKRAD